MVRLEGSGSRGIAPDYQRTSNRSATRRSTLMIAMIICVTVFLTPRAASAREAAAGSPASRLFESFFARVIAAGEDSQLPEGTTGKAKEIKFDLERDLIRIDAEIQILKLEVARFTGERQSESMERLMRTVADREMKIFVRLRQLEELAGLPGCNDDVEPEVMTSETPEGDRPRLKITWEPEDLADDPQP